MSEPRAAAFERVFRAEHAALVKFCFRRVDDFELALDLAAEAFRIAWGRWDEPRRSDRAWLFGVARNLIGNEYSRRTTRPSVRLITDEHVGLRDVRSERDFEAVEVHAALAALQPVHQEVLRLAYWEGLTAAEIAEFLGITPAAVWVRLSRARRAFSLAWQGRVPSLTIAPARTNR